MSYFFAVPIAIAVFLAILTIIVFVHEMGHYLVARWNGVAVEAFSVGFGHELFGFTDKNGTRWKISAIPLGGYVKFVGDMNEASVPDFEADEENDPLMRARMFKYKNVWQRISIVAAGPLINILFTFVILYGLLIGLGREIVEAKIDAVLPDSPAAMAGFEPGDKVLSVDGYKVRSFRDLLRLVVTSPDRDMVVEIERAGTVRPLDVRTGTTKHTDRFGNHSEIGFLGVSRQAEREEVMFFRPGPVEAVAITFDEMVLIVHRSLEFIGRFFVGKGDLDQLAGPPKMVKISGEAASIGFLSVVKLMAFLSLNIGIVNLMPIPVLDGGHLMFYLYELVRGKPLGRRAQEIGFMVGMVFVMSLMIFITTNDISSLWLQSR